MSPEFHFKTEFREFHQFFVKTEKQSV